ncbi:hypothetical protein BDA99DRAFT_427527, partial [Phascolomyces articulosus]
EFGSMNTSTKIKLYNDKLKSVLTTKVYLNDAIKRMEHLPHDKIASIEIPIIQILGVGCHVYGLMLIDK